MLCVKNLTEKNEPIHEDKYRLLHKLIDTYIEDTDSVHFGFFLVSLL